MNEIVGRFFGCLNDSLGWVEDITASTFEAVQQNSMDKARKCLKSILARKKADSHEEGLNLIERLKALGKEENDELE